MKPEHAWILVRLTEHLKKHRDTTFGRALIDTGIIQGLQQGDPEDPFSCCVDPSGEKDATIIKRIKQSL